MEHLGGSASYRQSAHTDKLLAFTTASQHEHPSSGALNKKLPPTRPQPPSPRHPCHAAPPQQL